MKIIRNGDLRYARKPLQFECKNCKTVFEAEKTEYQYCGNQIEGSNYKCECPLCHKMVYYNWKILTNYQKDQEKEEIAKEHVVARI